MNITAVIVAVLLASVITAVGGFWLLPMLRRLHFGQTILEIGPKWHQGKQGTPTMGGLMFIIGIPIAVVVAYLFMHASTVGDPMSAIMRARMFYGLVLALLFGAIGFLDDYLKVVKKQNEGLTEKQKMALQILFGAVYLLLLHISGTQSTMVTIPYIGTYDFGVFYYVFAMFAIIALSNAVNFTDGLDGLLSSVTLVLSIGYLIFCYLLGMGEMGIMAGALGGGCIGFLFWNHYPAKVFMGDTGSLFMSGMVIALAFGTGLPFFVVLFGIIYVIEIVSVVLQRCYFKLTHGKRIFKMSPFHHHFEMSGYTEKQIVVMFAVITAIGSALGILALRFI